MTLFGIRGEAKAVNEYLLEHSIRTPSIIVDTANSANLYLLPYATEPELLTPSSQKHQNVQKSQS